MSQLPPEGKTPIKIVLLVIVLIAVIILAVGLARLYMPGSSSSGSQPKTQAATSKDFTVYHDRGPLNEGAFTMLLPKGWSAQGGTERYQYPLAQFDFNVTARDSTGTMNIFFASGDFPYFIEPNANLASTTYLGCASADLSTFGACTDGTWWLPSGWHGSAPGLCVCAFVESYMSASDYIRHVSDGSIGVPLRYQNHALLPILTRTHPDVQIKNVVDNPNLYKRVLNVAGTQYSGADALFSYTENGQQYEYSLQLLIIRDVFPPVLGNFAMWFTYFWGYSAPAPSFDNGTVGALYSMVIPSVRVNPHWLVTQIQTANQQTSMIAQSNQQIQQMQYSFFMSEQEADFRTGQGWLHALDATSTAYDSNFSDGITVPYGYNTFDCGLTIRLTTSSTNPDPISCTPMNIGTPPSH
jgi:hypothetical protein